jgi:hypothetical protein
MDIVDKMIKDFQDKTGRVIYSSESFPGSYDDIYVDYLISQLIEANERIAMNTRPNDAKWISVEDGLPKTGQIVIAFEPHCLNNPDMGMTLVVVDDTFHEVKRHDGKPWVTHWMPAITPPKQSSEGEE